MIFLHRVGGRRKRRFGLGQVKQSRFDQRPDIERAQGEEQPKENENNHTPG